MEKEPVSQTANEPEKLPNIVRVNNCYEYVMKRNGKDLKNIPEQEIKSFIGQALPEIDLLEEVAERDKGEFDLPEEVAKKISVVWIISGSGTYFQAKKEDRYKNYPWADWMDRTRINHATRLERKITEGVSGQSFKVPLSEIVVAKKKTKEAILKYGSPEIMNTDQGSQFTSQAWIAKLTSLNIKISMDGRGRWMDNVFIERLWRSLKYECVYLQAFENGTETREGIGGWIRYYNSERPHSSLDGGTPDEVYSNSKYKKRAA